MRDKKSAERASTSPAIRPSQRSWFAVAAAWVAVSLPLAWGIYKTIEKAAFLFRAG